MALINQIPTFRADFPEFADTTKYPDSLINFWAGIGVLRLNIPRWGTLYTQGLELFTAHFISQSALNQLTSANGGIPGMQRGAISSEDAGVSVSYDTGAVTIEGAGHWNLTTYGTQFMELARMVGAGPIQINAGPANAGDLGIGQGIGGPDGFGWNMF